MKEPVFEFRASLVEVKLVALDGELNGKEETTYDQRE